jgi:hypothetical protein
MTNAESFEKFRLEETYKSLTSLGTETIKALILVNGAAAAGELTFLGSVLKDLNLTRTTLDYLVRGMGSYVFGVGLATIAFVLSFISQETGYRASRGAFLSGKKPNPQDGRELHHWLLYLATVFAILSVLAFGVGTFWNAQGLFSIGVSCKDAHALVQ